VFAARTDAKLRSNPGELEPSSAVSWALGWRKRDPGRKPGLWKSDRSSVNA